jgi:hypothetical protein
MLHNVLLGAHLLGVLTLVVGLTIEASGVIGLVRSRSTEALRASLYRLGWLQYVMPAAVVLLLGGGIGLSLTGPHGALSNLWTVPWIGVSLAITLVMTVVGLGVIEPGLHRIQQVAQGDHLSEPLMQAAIAPRLHYLAWGGMGSVVGIVILMMAKPGLVACLVIVGVTVLAGLLTARLLLATRVHTHMAVPVRE